MVYELPFFNSAHKKALRAVAGGWQISAVKQFQTDTPSLIGNADDYLGTGDTNTKRWNLSGQPALKHEFT